MGIKVLGIAPYRGLKELIEHIGREDNSLDLYAVYGNLQEGLNAAESAEEQGYEIILSRGGTAKLIKEHVSIPVIDIQVSGYDVLRVLTLAKDYNGRVAILGFPSISNGAATICNLLGIDVAAYTIFDEKEVEPKLTEIKNKGFDVIIGDVITVETARKLGLQEILITSGSESVRDAFQDAKNIHRFFHHMNRREHLLKQALDQSKQGILILNHQKQVVYSNQTAEKMIETTEFLSLDAVQVLLQKTTKNEESTALVSVNEKIYPVSAILRQQGAQGYILFFIDPPFSSLQREMGITIKEGHSLKNPYPFSRITGSSEEIRQTVEKAREFSPFNIPVWFSGESGTGKDMFADATHQASDRYNLPFIQLDPLLIKPEQWDDLLSQEKKERSQLPRFGTLYIKNIEQLPSPISNRLAFLLKSAGDEFPRLIISSQKNKGDLSKVPSFSGELYNLLVQGHIPLPPLRERKTDIEDLIRLFIAHFNSVYGKEIVGVDNDLLHRLQSFSWPGNVSQLRRVTEQFILQSAGPYIQTKEVETVLNDLELETLAPPLGDIDLTGTLEEIEKQIIKKILHEENMNQSRTAKRLGINRTTLWRKLK